MRVTGGFARGRVLKTRKGWETRPTADRVREALFNMLVGSVQDSRFLDVFAGNGSVGIEALSRGARFCVFIEKSSQCVKIIRDNLELTGLSAYGRVICSEAVAALTKLRRSGEVFDIVFLDPPYHSPELGPALRQVMVKGLVASGGMVVVEHHRLDAAWRDPAWTVYKEKKYGDTMLTFLLPPAAGDETGSRNGEEM